jgi:hypothetical protein
VYRNAPRTAVPQSMARNWHTTEGSLESAATRSARDKRQDPASEARKARPRHTIDVRALPKSRVLSLRAVE